MAWTSATFRKPDGPVEASATQAIAQAVEKHRAAMDEILRQARELAEDHRRALDAIQDPRLRQSAAR